ncbi:MAG TPA: peptidoglycan bridge formation glycyltransferase FemA/FemB family protein [Natronosporangium sp.]
MRASTTSWRPAAPPDWDDALFAVDGHFLQSSHWFAFQTALDRPTFFGRGDGWSCAAYLEAGGARLYAPYGPTVTGPGGLGGALAALVELAGEVGAERVRVEPFGAESDPAAELTGRGFQRNPKDYQPSLTWVRNLRCTREELLRGMYKANRQRYRTAANRGLSFHTSTDPADVDVFVEMVHVVAERTGITPHRDDYYRTMARAMMPRGAMTLYLAEHEQQPVAGVLVFDSPTVRYTVHSGSFPVARKLHAASPLRTQIMLDAHAAGQRWLDFWGVAPPDQPEHRWAGFTRFKQSFGGDYLRYAGTWELARA